MKEKSGALWSRKICKRTGTYRSRARLMGMTKSMLLCPGLQVGVLRCKASLRGAFREGALSPTCHVWEDLESEPLASGQKTAVHCAAAKMPRDPDDDRDFVVQSWDTWQRLCIAPILPSLWICITLSKGLVLGLGLFLVMDSGQT